MIFLPGLISLECRVWVARRRNACIGTRLAVPLAAQTVANAQHAKMTRIVVLRQRFDTFQVLRYGLLRTLQFGGRRQAELGGPQRGVVAQLPQAGGGLKLRPQSVGQLTQDVLVFDHIQVRECVQVRRAGLMISAQVFGDLGGITEGGAGIYFGQCEIGPGEFGLSNRRSLEELYSRWRIFPHQRPRVKVHIARVIRAPGKFFLKLSRQAAGLRFRLQFDEPPVEKQIVRGLRHSLSNFRDLVVPIGLAQLDARVPVRRERLNGSGGLTGIDGRLAARGIRKQGNNQNCQRGENTHCFQCRLTSAIPATCSNPSLLEIGQPKSTPPLAEDSSGV